MCAGAIVNSRIKRVVYGAPDPKAGGCGSVLDVTGCAKLNHRPEVVAGVRRTESLELIERFLCQGRPGPMRDWARSLVDRSHAS